MAKFAVPGTTCCFYLDDLTRFCYFPVSGFQVRALRETFKLVINADAVRALLERYSSHPSRTINASPQKPRDFHRYLRR